MYIHANWRDSKNIHKGNKPFKFWVELPKPLYLDSGLWYMSLADISYENTTTNNSFFVFSDIAEESCVSGRMLPFLRRVHEEGSFSTQYFIKVLRNHINRIKFHITNCDLEEIDNIDNINLTICLKKFGIDTL